MIFEYGLEDEFTFNKSEMNIYCKNGNEFISFGSDDPEKVKSIVDPSHIWCEEFTDYNFDDYTQLNLRLRTEKADCLQFIGTFNPIDEKHWIKEELIDNEKIDKIVLRTTYKDNNFIDSDYKTVLGQLKGNDYIVYASGEWGVLKVQSPYMNAFDENLNVNKKAVFEPGKAIRLSFDFNVDNCVCVLSHAGLDYIHFFKELVSDNLPNLLTLVERTYGNYKASFTITGDRSGKARHHLVSDNMNSYRMIKKRLLLKDRQFNIKTNPLHSENRFTCNTILFYHPNVYFHPDMKETIYDLLYVECDQNESIIKKDRNVSNQKADLLDCFTGDTLIMTIDGQEPISETRMGQLVKTSKGYRRVVDEWSSMAKVYEFRLGNGDKIKCTKDHKFYVHNFGFLPIFLIFALKLKLCKSSTTESYIGNIQNKSIFIAHSQRKSIPGVFIGRFGLIIMALYRKVGRCIIKMGMLLTMTLRTLRLLVVQSTCVTMQIKGLKKTLSSFKGWQKQEESMLKNGTGQKKESSGTKNTLKRQDLERRHLVYGIVSYVIQATRQRILIKDSVQTNVKQKADFSLGLIILTRFVNIAMGYLSRTNIGKQDFARDHVGCQVIGMKYVGRKKVYDITVEGNPEFYANGYLAHNCVRYTFNTFHADFVKKYRFKKTA